MTKNKYMKALSQDTCCYDIAAFAHDHGVDIHTLPFSIRILLENALRQSSQENPAANALRILNWQANTGKDIAFYPARILLQDYTGVPCIVDLASMRDAAQAMGIDPEKINPKIPVDLVIDHSVQIDQSSSDWAMSYNIKKEFERNKERYEFLKWAQLSFENVRVIPPDTGIIHQINIEYLSPVIQNDGKTQVCYPDSVFGTDSHTTMINGLGVLGWGVGGIEAEACMLGEPSVFAVPEVIGVHLIHQLPPGTVATDLALKVTQVLRSENVVGKFVEYYGEGYQSLSLADRATLSNMAPEYGSTCGYFPLDAEAIGYLRLTGRDSGDVERIETYARGNALFYTEEDELSIQYTKRIEIDLALIETNLSGPKRPQDLVPLSALSDAFKSAIVQEAGNHGFGLQADDIDATYPFVLDGSDEVLHTGDILIAAITSCTNTSNPYVLIGAGIMARNAVQRGLSVSRKVKTSFAPGSQAVTNYLEKAGLMPYLNTLGFNIVAYGCTTCIGNSGPLNPAIEDALKASEIVAGAVLSGNRNFESRIHPLIKANYLASPLLVIAFAIAGNLKVNLQTDCLGVDGSGRPVYLNDIWPSSSEIQMMVHQYVTSETYQEAYQNIFSGTKEWEDLVVEPSSTFSWNPDSTYVTNPPYFDAQIRDAITLPSYQSMRVLAKLGNSVTTDHISPAGSIPEHSPAGTYLLDHGVQVKNFNSYGSRRGNDRVMTRGTLANTRLANTLAEGKIGGYTTYFPTRTLTTIYDASQRYLGDGTELMVVAGADYGMGSSRDWAAKGVKLLGVKAVIAVSFERIHRSNLVMMGVLPLQFLDGESASSIGLTGEEVISIDFPETLLPHQILTLRAESPNGMLTFQARSRFDSQVEIDDYYVGGILNKVLAERIAEFRHD